MSAPLPDLQALLAKHYASDVTEVLPLAGEVDLNFRVTTTNGRRLTAKVSRPGAKPEAIAFETAILRHLAGKDLTFKTPHPVGEVVPLQGGRLLRVQTWVEGRMLGDVTPITDDLRDQWGSVAGQLSAALKDFNHPAAPTNYKWNPSQTLDSRPLGKYFTPDQRELADHFWDQFEHSALPHLKDLPQQIIYADAHQHNLLVDNTGHICGVIDFGDAIHTHAVNELAIACAYAGMDTPDPVSAMAQVVRGYDVFLPYGQTELLFDFIVARLLITVATAAANSHREPDNEYLQVSAAPAWRLLGKLRKIPAPKVRFLLRSACGAPRPDHQLLTEWMKRTTFHSVVDLKGKNLIPLDLSVGSTTLGLNRNFTDPDRFSRLIRRHLEDHDADFAVGGYRETRPVYTTDDFATEGNDGPRWRSVHLGADVWGVAGTKVFAPYSGVVHSYGTDPTRGGYGAVIILEHKGVNDLPFYTLYGHLSADSLTGLRAGAQAAPERSRWVQSGEEIARFGTEQENGGWPPHLHFQVMLDTLGQKGDFPGVAYPDEAGAWLKLCPDPHPFLPDLPAHVLLPLSAVDSDPRKRHDREEELTERRKKQLGYSLSLSYAQPLHLVRGSGQYLYDTTGRRFLDTVNNVAHVGHEHPAVVEAIQRQAAVLNTNSRYLHDEIVAFAEELTATMPDALSVVHFVNSGSEANELALRMCAAWAGTRNMLAVEVGYHGNTGRTIDVSSYKFDGKGGKGAPPQTTIVPSPDVFRGRHRNAATAGQDYANYVLSAIQKAETTGKQYGGFLGESILSCGGQIVLPQGYLQKVYAAVRAHGGLCVSDEVQVGLGRVGTHWWGFELQGVVPDIVTIGKPLGNGHPLGAVVCTPAVAERFANGMEYFNTFGGNPVSCAAGRAVLRTVRQEGLREQAQATGDYLQTLLRQLQEKFPVIGDVRGEGLFLGFELVGPDLAPATAPAKYLKNRMRQLGILMSTDGPDDNVIKIKPPMCFDRRNADLVVKYLDRVLGEDAMRAFPATRC